MKSEAEIKEYIENIRKDISKIKNNFKNNLYLKRMILDRQQDIEMLKWVLKNPTTKTTSTRKTTPKTK